MVIFFLCKNILTKNCVVLGVQSDFWELNLPRLNEEGK
jgi:hypothetical protein